MSVETKIGQRFLHILDSSFPPGNPLHRALNRHTVQMSYRTMANLGCIITAHNTKVLQNDLPVQRPFNANCNCRGGPKNCPMDGARCLDTNTIYNAEVEADGKEKQTYIGLSKPEWKTRCGNHKTNFKHSAQRVKTTLAGYVWELKGQNVDFNIKWTTMARARAFTPSSKMCRLCLMEKVKIMQTGSTLNKRTEFFSSCRQKEGLLLS